MDYHRPTYVVTPTAAAVSEVVSLPEKSSASRPPGGQLLSWRAFFLYSKKQRLPETLLVFVRVISAPSPSCTRTQLSLLTVLRVGTLPHYTSMMPEHCVDDLMLPGPGAPKGSGALGVK